PPRDLRAHHVPPAGPTRRGPRREGRSEDARGVRCRLRALRRAGPGRREDREGVMRLTLLPRRGAVALGRTYKRCLSPLLPPACRFHPTCSDYVTEAVTRHGVIKG